MNVSFVTDRLAVGNSIDTTADLELLAQKGITHIINCRAEFDDSTIPDFSKYFSFPTSTALRYQWCPTNDDGQPKPASWFNPGIVFGLAALCVPRNKLYVHCQGGINRGPSMTLAILRAWGIGKLAASTMLLTAHPSSNPWCRYWGDAEAALKDLGYD